MQWTFISREQCSPGVWIAGVATAALILGSSGGPTRFYPMKDRPGRHGLARIHEHRSDNSWTSDNWAGYAIAASNGSLPSGSVTMVSGSWVVPSVNCTGSSGATNGYASFWVGIDGWTSNTVEQIGTDSDCVNPETGAGSTPSYYAWFEFYPQSAYYIGSPSNNFKGYTVQPGDVISAKVSATGGNGNFTATITDTRSNVQQWTFTTNGRAHGAKQTSAEWIAEAPCCEKSGNVLPLANFGFANYGSEHTGIAQTATVQGTTGPIGSFGQNIQETTMVGSAGNEAVPTSLMPNPSSPSSESFQVEWYRSGP